MSEQRITVGPLTFVAVRGDVYEAGTKHLDANSLTRTQLSNDLGTSRQNIQRAVRRQQSLRLETLTSTIRTSAKLRRKRFDPSELRATHDSRGLAPVTR